MFKIVSSYTKFQFKTVSSSTRVIPVPKLESTIVHGQTLEFTRFSRGIFCFSLTPVRFSSSFTYGVHFLVDNTLGE